MAGSLLAGLDVSHHEAAARSPDSETGFLEAAALDTPELFQQKQLESELEKVTVEVSGVNVTKFQQFLNQVLERAGSAPDKSDPLEKLVDDAIFQLVYERS